MRPYLLAGLALASLGACATPGRAVVHDFNVIPGDRISAGMNRRFVMTDKSTMAIYELRRGAVVPVHKHDSEQLSYVQSGRLRFTVSGESFVLSPGQMITIPPNAPHSIEAIENSVEYDYFTPPRKSWTEDRDEGPR